METSNELKQLKLQLATLRKLAKEATPGPWSFYDDSNDGKTNRIEIVAIGKTVARIYHSVPDEDLPNARLIATANPSTILQLLDYIETLEKDAARYRYLRDDGEGFDISVLERDAEDDELWVHGYPPEELEAAIDAAMQGETE